MRNSARLFTAWQQAKTAEAQTHLRKQYETALRAEARERWVATQRREREFVPLTVGLKTGGTERSRPSATEKRAARRAEQAARRERIGY